VKAYYRRGGITIYHADALDILPRLAGVGAVVTDSPYSSGGQYRGDRSQPTTTKYVQSQTKSYRAEFAGDNRDQRSYLAWAALWLNAARRASTPGALVVSFIDWRQLPTMTDAVQAGGWIWRGIAPWSKRFGRPRAGGFSSACEFAVWGSNGPMRAHKAYPAGIVECTAPPNKARQHVTQKPERVMAWALAPVPKGAVVLDPFMGSGTTLVAARALGYAAIGVEVDERYCEIAARRLDDLMNAPKIDRAPAAA
jgi:site-specific DNA-methyltransferase (adenine-specific)